MPQTPVTLAILWHQHQPYYPDDVSGETLMPWVRLHATKDYYGMAMHLLEVPEFHCTINLVPSLIVQLQRYTDHSGSDRHLDVSRLPVDGLAEEDLIYLMDNFFMANVSSMVRPYERYHELYLKRGFNIDSAAEAAKRFSKDDLRDLQIWSNLTWIHELAFEQYPELKEFREKGSGWTEEEKAWLLEKQMSIVGEVIPLHKKLALSGQVELTTTPFYHPILPLLWNKQSAHEEMPGCDLPRHMEPYPEDAHRHIQAAVKFHEETFGMAPRGMWPSEGSVSQEILPAIKEAGIEWIATDEEVLASSTEGWVARDSHGHLKNPQMLYRPWLAGGNEDPLQMVFRDHALSDLIGFHYQRSTPQQAADDLIGRLMQIGKAVEHQNGDRPALVPVILDGENCWEYYPDGGVGFLRALYQNAVQHPMVKPKRICDTLDEHPATDHIRHLSAGSWISHNFAIWIGHHEDNAAWDLLHETRSFLLDAEKSSDFTNDELQQAWRELDIAQGSDWFWWYGDDHSSAQDDLFDQLFRKHLRNVYTLLNQHAPGSLSQAIAQGGNQKIHTDPTRFLHVIVNGRKTYFEWINAGRYECSNQRGTMTLTTEGIFKEIYFGFDVERFYLRIDTHHRAQDDLQAEDEIHLRFHAPFNSEIQLSKLNSSAPVCHFLRNNKKVKGTTTEVAVEETFEFSVLLKDLSVSASDRLQFHLDLIQKGQSIERSPHEGLFELIVPSADFENIMWQV